MLTEDVPKLKCTPISLAHATSKPSADITITIWQHPQGGVKVMSNFHVEKMTDEGSISYQNDTEPGSSGSPIFDNVGGLSASTPKVAATLTAAACSSASPMQSRRTRRRR